MSEWIYVKDRLPKPGIHVLWFEPIEIAEMMRRSHQVNIGYIGLNQEDQKNTGKTIVYHYSGPASFIGTHATHWMPIPKLPKFTFKEPKDSAL